MATVVFTPKLRGYVLDDQGALRRHMMVFGSCRDVCCHHWLTSPLNGKFGLGFGFGLVLAAAPPVTRRIASMSMV